MVKKLKPRVLTATQVLRLPTPKAVAAATGKQDLIDDIFDVMLDADRWQDGDLPMRATEVLIGVGESVGVVDAFVDLAIEFSADDDGDDVSDVEIVLGAIGVVIGRHADVASADVLLDALDASLVELGHPMSGWHEVLEVLVAFGDRGHQSERTWGWLERLRAEDPILWCIFADGYPRALPALRALMDDVDADLAGDDAVDLVIEAAAALEALGGLTPEDSARRARAVAIRVERQLRFK